MSRKYTVLGNFLNVDNLYSNKISLSPKQHVRTLSLPFIGTLKTPGVNRKSLTTLYFYLPNQAKLWYFLTYYLIIILPLGRLKLNLLIKNSLGFLLYFIFQAMAITPILVVTCHNLKSSLTSPKSKLSKQRAFTQIHEEIGQQNF